MYVVQQPIIKLVKKWWCTIFNTSSFVSCSSFLSVVFGEPLVTFIFCHGLKIWKHKTAQIQLMSNTYYIFKVERKLLEQHKPYQASHFLWGQTWTVAWKPHLPQSRSHDYPKNKKVQFTFLNRYWPHLMIQCICHALTGSAKMTTSTVAFPGVSRLTNGVRIFWFSFFIKASRSGSCEILQNFG